MNNWIRKNAHIITIAFGTTMAMWTGGYIFHLPFLTLPGSVSLCYFLLCLIAAGYYNAKHSQTPVIDGVKTGVFISILNLLILGSVIGGGQSGEVVPSILIWLPGFIAFGALFLAVVSFIFATMVKKPVSNANWLGTFSLITAGGTLLLIMAGGIVTSAEAGLAVTDWPNSYGYNMFLFPLSKMTGGIYYEHSHRLLGSLVGLTTIELAFLIFAISDKGWIKGLSVAAVILVIAQGIMGGLRVTGYFTMSQSPEETEPNITLAIIHGITGQLYFTLLVAIAAFTSTAWTEQETVPHVKAKTERVMATILVGMLIVQLIFGSWLRHMYGNTILIIHFSFAVLIILKAAMLAARAWFGKVHPLLLKRVGGALGILVILQFVLGICALVGVVSSRNAGEPTALDLVFSTMHQTNGALLLAAAVLLMLWTGRLFKQEDVA